MTLNDIHTLFAYDNWANALMFDAAAALPPEQIGRPVAGSFPSLSATLAHIVATDWAWMRRWLGENPDRLPDWVAAPDIADLRARLSMIEREREAFLAGLSDADLARAVSYRLLSGAPHSSRLDDLFLHVANHSTYHRGQVANQLRELGHKPPATDFLWFRMQAA